MTTTETACRSDVKHVSRRDPHLGRLVHEYRAVCVCGHRGKATDEPRARREAQLHEVGA